METEQTKAMLMGLYEAARIKAPDAIADPSAENFVGHSPQVATALASGG